MRRMVCTAFALMLAVTAPSRADTLGHVASGGVERNFLIHVPAKLPPHPALVLVFHGGGGTPAGMARLTGFDAQADQHGFIVVYPQGLERHWNDGRSTIKNKVDDVGFVTALVAQLTARYAIDPARIYATGMSNGAIFTNFLGCRMAGTFAAIAPVAGSLAVGMTPGCEPAGPLSVLMIAGTADPIMPFDGGAVRNFHGHGEGGYVLGAGHSAAFWQFIDGCAGTSAPLYPAPLVANDLTRLEIYKATGCRAGYDVQEINVLLAGHIWPGGPQYLPRFIIGPDSHQMNASAAITDFFLAHPRP
jgi:polyhydroxybutyrate depolymerase